MLCKILVGGIDIGLVSARVGNARLEVVRDQDLGARPERTRRHAHGIGSRRVSPESGRPLRRYSCWRPRAAIKIWAWIHLAGSRINDGDRLAGIIDEELLPGPVLLPEGDIELSLPTADSGGRTGCTDSPRGWPVCTRTTEVGDPFTYPATAEEGPSRAFPATKTNRKSPRGSRESIRRRASSGVNGAPDHERAPLPTGPSGSTGPSC